MNNKGQTLAIFIIVIPIILLLVCMIIDLGKLSLEKKQLQNVIKAIIKDELKKGPDRKRIINLINKNTSDMKIDNIIIENGIITITISKQYTGLFPNLLKNMKTINLTYKGYKINDNITIKKE